MGDILASAYLRTCPNGHWRARVTRGNQFYGSEFCNKSAGRVEIAKLHTEGTLSKEESKALFDQLDSLSMANLCTAGHAPCPYLRNQGESVEPDGVIICFVPEEDDSASPAATKH